MGDDEAMAVESRGRGEREGEREVDVETESRISSAMCQPVPVAVFTRIQYLRTHVYPPHRHPKATSSNFSQTAQCAPQARVTSEWAKIVAGYFLFWAEQSLIQTQVIKKHEDMVCYLASMHLGMLNPV